MPWTIMDLPWRKRRCFVPLISIEYVFLKRPDISAKKSVGYQIFGMLFYFITEITRPTKIQQRFQQKIRVSNNMSKHIQSWKTIVSFLGWLLGTRSQLMSCSQMNFVSTKPVFKIHRPPHPPRPVSGKTPPSFWRLLWRFSKVRRSRWKKKQPNSQKIGCVFKLGIWVCALPRKIWNHVRDVFLKSKLLGMMMVWW